MRADNTEHLAAAARRRSNETLTRAHTALDELTRTGEPLSVAGLAVAASVSRSWLYTQPQLLERIELLRQQRPQATRRDTIPAGQRASATSLQRRLELAHHRIQQLNEDNRRLQDELARAYGRLRATDATGTPGRVP